MGTHRNKQLLIVGQGIAGTLFSYLCLKNGISFDLVDNGHRKSSSIVSSGIINPVTGKRYVKSWEYEELKEYFVPIYEEISDMMEFQVFREMETIVVLHSAEAMNFWDTRKHDTEYDEYLTDDPVTGKFRNFIGEQETGKIKGCYQVAIRELLAGWRQLLIEKNLYVASDVDVDQLTAKDRIQLGSTEYEKVVLCTGAEAARENLWSAVPFDPLKGEVLIDASKDFSGSDILKRKLFFVPLPDGRLWIGATYDRDYGEEEGITEEARKMMLDTIHEYLDYEPVVSKHLVALRPTLRDRRPVLGKHPHKENVYLFNGLGTKGMSLGPYCAVKLYEYMYENGEMPDEISLERFYDASSI